MSNAQLSWLPRKSDFQERLRELKGFSEPSLTVARGVHELVKQRYDFLEATKLDKLTEQLKSAGAYEELGLPRYRLAILATSTVDHLLPSIRLAGIRRGILLDIYVGDYGQLFQEVFNEASGLHAFKPDIIFYSLDSRQLQNTDGAGMTNDQLEEELDRSVESYVDLWREAKSRFQCEIIQQIPMPIGTSVYGVSELMFAASPATIMNTFSEKLRIAARSENCAVVDLPQLALRYGLDSLTDSKLWWSAKQEISHLAAPIYGDHVARAVQALMGLSKRCLVLDLDNTLWSGVVGDMGISGIRLGAGSAEGEAFYDFQRYCKQLKDRGVILAICSKNDVALVEEVIETHPEMYLSRDDFAAMRANWENKAKNIQEIADELGIAPDTFVFFDDNPAERELVREMLPEVSVPEVPLDPSEYQRCLSDSGYFDVVRLTEDDRIRASSYTQSQKRKELQKQSTNLADYLDGLDMKMEFSPLGSQDFDRALQLINKTNQFNFTTRRRTDSELRQYMETPGHEGYVARLNDRFGANGLIKVLLIKTEEFNNKKAWRIDTWVMSCRVLGRTMEHATFTHLAQMAQAAGCGYILGEYAPTERNGLVAGIYPEFGFKVLGNTTDETVAQEFAFDLSELPNISHHIRTIEVTP